MERKRIVIVDDEPDILESLARLLGDELPGVDVVTASSGEEGLRILAGRPPQLILADYRMPCMDGTEFLSRCAALFPGLPLVMMTAFPEPIPAVEIQARRRAGITGFHAKNHPPADLVDMVAMALGIRAVH